ncbi:unnamed protein product [Ilex paraguariensis]|uniref:FH2 domain-containing protein n=1 Tax=Ilex paraguariensis TaxID=185542 RepID=A0ABC8UQG5_9AQUA
MAPPTSLFCFPGLISLIFHNAFAIGSAVGFRLDSLLKLTETRARNNKMTLMHYLCKVIADKLPELLDFSKDLISLEPASKIQLKFLAEEMQAISKGLEKVVQELSMSENDGPVSINFRKANSGIELIFLEGPRLRSAVGFRLDSLLKLTETRARNNKMTLMHYLCKVIADKLPELLDFSKDLISLEPASKIQLKFLAEEMQAISKGLEKVVQELSMSENDGPVSINFRKVLKEFLSFSEGEVRSLASLYSGVGRNVDALILYFGEDPSRCPFEQVISTILNFVRMFNKSHEENCKQLEFERKKAEKEASNEKLKINASQTDTGHFMHSPIKSVK